MDDVMIDLILDEEAHKCMVLLACLCVLIIFGCFGGFLAHEHDMQHQCQ
jgi:hypothetical protein